MNVLNELEFFYTTYICKLVIGKLAEVGRR